ncbi:MAG: hypothetical protein ACRC5M_00305, partial [Anaeroplasmataceae bacterium]
MLDPLNGYNNYFKQLHKENAENLFEELTKMAQVDIEQNKATILKFDELTKESKKVKDKLVLRLFFRKFLMFLLIACVATVGITSFLTYGIETMDTQSYIITVSVCGSVFVLIILFIYLFLNKVIRKVKEEFAEVEKRRNSILSEAWEQMSVLNSLYDWNLSSDLLKKTIPLLEMDKNFDVKKFQFMSEKYNFSNNTSPNSSTIAVQSGSILGNPFVLTQNLIQSDSTRPYTGTKLITWTTRRRVNDRMVTTTHTQTLVATLYRFHPVYHVETSLLYGNDAAPDLSFSRTECKASGYNEKQLEKYVSKKSKSFEKLERK